MVFFCVSSLQLHSANISCKAYICLLSAFPALKDSKDQMALHCIFWSFLPEKLLDKLDKFELLWVVDILGWFDCNWPIWFIFINGWERNVTIGKNAQSICLKRLTAGLIFVLHNLQGVPCLPDMISNPLCIRYSLNKLLALWEGLAINRTTINDRSWPNVR